MWRFAVVFVLVACYASVCIQAGKHRMHETSHRARRKEVDYSQALNSKAAAACPPDCPSDCQELYDNFGYVQDGRYIIYLIADSSRELLVYCDMDDGQGWTVFQSRVNGETDFNRNRTEYEYGFGFTTADFWMGLIDMYYLLAHKNYQMRVDLVDFDGATAYSEYDYFMIGSALMNYSISYSYYRGSVGNSLQPSSTKFTTLDHDLDISPNENCAVTHQGAWWYQGCGNSNLNGRYNPEKSNCVHTNNYWYSFRQYCPLKSTTMKFRPM